MFSKASIIKEVNIINKFVCYLIVIACLIILRDPMFLTFVDIFFLLLTKDNKKLFIYNILITIFTATTIFNPQFLWISKIFFLVLYTILLKNVTELKDLRYVIEFSLYKFNQKQITYKFFYAIYFLKNIKKNFKRMLLLSDDYQMKFTPKFIYFIFKQSIYKARLEKDNFEELNKIRFYNYSSKRTYIEENTWETWDTTYIICYVIILLLVIFYGR